MYRSATVLQSAPVMRAARLNGTGLSTLAVLTAALLLVSPRSGPSEVSPTLVRGFLAVMGGLQFGAFALSDYAWPKAEVEAGAT